MIRKILVPASGSNTDSNVFETALAIARTTQAHLEFYHVRHSPAVAPPRAPQHAVEFCVANGIPRVDEPHATEEVTASFSEEADHAMDRLLNRARHSDLVVWGRRQHLDYMPAAVVEDLLTYSGRPIILAARQPAQRITDTIVVGWNDTSRSAHALDVVLPLLKRAKRVVVVSVSEAAASAHASLALLSSQLLWHGISPQVCFIEDKLSKASLRLQRKALDLKAQLLVLGGFGRGPTRHYSLSGVSRNFLESAGCPVLFVH
jgi:nucleotide-binding universal stress UspA family protein